MSNTLNRKQRLASAAVWGAFAAAGIAFLATNHACRSRALAESPPPYSSSSEPLYAAPALEGAVDVLRRVESLGPVEVLTQAEVQGGVVASKVAETVQAAAPASPNRAEWTMLLGALFGLLALAVRRIAPESHWLHEKVGMAAIVGASSALSAVADVAASGHLTVFTALSAAVAALSAAVGAYNPSKRESRAAIDQAGKVDVRGLMTVVGFALVVAICAVVVFGCGPAGTARGVEFGRGALSCAGDVAPGVVDDGFETLERLAAGGRVSAADVGKSMAAKYGPGLALCLIEKAWRSWGGPALADGTLRADPSPKLLTVVWLREHPEAVK